MRSEQLYLIDIIEAAEAVGRFIAGVEHEDFINDDMRQSAVIQKILVIGQAAAHISATTRDKYPSAGFALAQFSFVQ